MILFNEIITELLCTPVCFEAGFLNAPRTRNFFRLQIHVTSLKISTCQCKGVTEDFKNAASAKLKNYHKKYH